MCSSDNDPARRDGSASAAARLVRSLRENKATRVERDEAYVVTRAERCLYKAEEAGHASLILRSSRSARYYVQQ